MKKTSKTRDAGGEELSSSILTSFRDTATRSNGFKVIRTRTRPISACVAADPDPVSDLSAGPYINYGTKNEPDTYFVPV